jgi:hypothetical protein
MELQPALMSEGVFFYGKQEVNHYCQFFRSHPDRKPVRQGTTGLEAGTLPRSVPNEAF